MQLLATLTLVAGPVLVTGYLPLHALVAYQDLNKRCLAISALVAALVLAGFALATDALDLAGLALAIDALVAAVVLLRVTGGGVF